jgi:hypothetical protein
MAKIGSKEHAKLTSKKAKTILSDGSVRGHKLTAKQKRYFGWVAGGSK